MVSKGAEVMSEMMPAAVDSLQSPVEDMSILKTGYSFGADGCYRIRVASDIEDRKKAWALKMYAELGYVEPEDNGMWCGVHDTLSEAYTLLVERDGEVLATLTVVPDSFLGLSADQVYQKEIDVLRSKGRKPCEIISLACQEKNLRHGAEIVKHLFKLAYLAASRLMGATDFLITVNPRHVRFYERTLLMKKKVRKRNSAR